MSDFLKSTALPPLHPDAGKILVTIDTEAQPARAPEDHVKKLILGDYETGNFGILRMMDIADSQDVKLVFFFDYAEYDLWGEELLDAAREIDRRGHDLQLHIHPEFVSKKRFEAFGSAKRVKFPDMNDDVAKKLADHILDLHSRCTSKPATAFRGGGYRYSGSILRALHERGVRYASNDNAFYDQPGLPQETRGPFKWANGITEIPVSTIKNFLNIDRISPYYFDMASLSAARYEREICVKRHGMFVEEFLGQHPEALAVMVLHSWSFCDKNDDGHRIIPNPESAGRFDGVLEKLKKLSEITTFSDLAQNGYGSAENFEVRTLQD